MGLPNRDEEVLRRSGERKPVFGLVDPGWRWEVVVSGELGLGVDGPVELNVQVVQNALVDVALHFLRAGVVARFVVAVVVVIEVGWDPSGVDVSVWVLPDLLNDELPKVSLGNVVVEDGLYGVGVVIED